MYCLYSLTSVALLCLFVSCLGDTERPPNIDSVKTSLNWTEGCKKGPEFWCENLKTAAECGATEHCHQTVWLHQTVVENDNTKACTTCISYIEGFRDATSSNTTIQQTEIVLDATCQLLPNYLLTKECVFVVNRFVPDILTLSKSLKPRKLCSLLFFCDGMAVNHEYLKYKGIEEELAKKKLNIKETEKPAPATSPVVTVTPEKSDIDCKGCFMLATTAQKMFNSTSRDDILNGMLEICGKMSSFSDACSSYVIAYFREIYQRLQSLSTNEVCHLSGTCAEKFHIHEVTPEIQTAIANAPDKPNDEVCDFCVAMVNHLRDMVIANTTVEEFQKVLEGICKQTGNFKDECLDLVDQYYNIVYQFLVGELNGKELCQDVKLCVRNVTGKKSEEVIPLFPVVPSSLNLDEQLKKETDKQHGSQELDLHRVQLTQEVGRKRLVGANRCTWGPSFWCNNMTTVKQCPGSLDHCIKNVWEKTVLPVDNGDICNICKDMVKQARDQLNSNETQEELKQALEEICKLIPIKIAKKECMEAMDDFAPELVEALSSQMNPQVVCATVGLCNSARMDLLLQQEKMSKTQLPIELMLPKFLETSDVKDEVIKRSKEACEICELFLHFVQQQMTLPQSEEKIKTVVNSVCVKLPKNVATQCSSFIEVYGDAFISILAQEVDPSLVCPSIGACSAYLGFIDQVKPTCPICLLAVESIEQKVKNNKTEKNVIAALDNICSELPHNTAKECILFVNNSYSGLVDSILADFAPQETCVYLKLCGATNDLAEMIPEQSIKDAEVIPAAVPVHPTAIAVEKDENKCVICEFIMSKLENELKDKKTAEEIKSAVHAVCRHLPNTISNQCDKFVTQYADLVIDLLVASMEPREICAEIGACKPSPSTPAIAAVAKGENSYIALKEQALTPNTHSPQFDTYIIYRCLAATLCFAVVVVLGIKIRRSLTKVNPPYVQVDK